MAGRISWRQALAWRMERQLLDPVGTVSVPDVVRRLCAVQTQVASYAELAIRVRRRSSRRGEVSRALAEGRVIKTWAMRGALHLLTPEDGGTFLALIAAGRRWELPSWQRYYRMTPKLWDLYLDTMRDLLDGVPRTKEELAGGIGRHASLKHVAKELLGGWGTLLKPLAWQGELCFGPSRASRVTFTRPKAAAARWRDLPPVDEAAPRAITSYLSAYGPATTAEFSYWMGGGGLVSRSKVNGWFRALGDRLVELNVDGDVAYGLREHEDSLLSAKPSMTVRLLPGFDQYVLGPGTQEGHVVSATRRWDVSRQSGWIAPVVVAGGAVCGTWGLNDDLVEISWFEEAGRMPRGAIDDEVARLGSILERPLRATNATARSARS